MFSFRSRALDIAFTLLLVGAGSAVAGLTAALLALKCFLYAAQPMPSGAQHLYFAASFAALILGPCIWWFMIIKPNRLSVGRGIWVGIAGSIIAHPLAWYLALFFAFIFKEKTVLGLVVTNPLFDILTSMGLSLYSLLVVGWITALIGGIAGGVIALLQSRFHCAQRWHGVVMSISLSNRAS